MPGETQRQQTTDRMETGSWKQTLVFVVVLLSTYVEASSSRHMDDFINSVKRLEAGGGGSGPLVVLRRLRSAAGLNDAFVQHFLGDAESGGGNLDPKLSAYFRKTVHHSVTGENQEEGVVLTQDGTTVALEPLLLGLEAGFIAKTSTNRVRGLYQLTLAKNLDKFALNQRLGPDGCWDSVTSPRVFTLMEAASSLTTAQVNGGMDGVILGTAVAESRPQTISGLLTEYYNHQLDGRGMDAAPRLISRRRRENFRGLVVTPLLARQVVKSVDLWRRLKGRSKMEAKDRKQLMAAVREGLKEFNHKYIECPPIIPRCMWGAEPYRGTPTNLTLPLSFLYIHHTHSPGQPCLTFEQCSADMRSMQRFHQDDRGWDDIGYSFVAGSDGHLYEGRGWFIQGAHTLGHNSIGYGVSFIGDYQDAPPSQHALGLVRGQLGPCAVAKGHLKVDYRVQGHRQVVNTSCPGDALYTEITSWEHFGEVEK